MANGPSPGYFTAGWRIRPLCMVPYFHFSNFARVGGGVWEGTGGGGHSLKRVPARHGDTNGRVGPDDTITLFSMNTSVNMFGREGGGWWGGSGGVVGGGKMR